MNREKVKECLYRPVLSVDLLLNINISPAHHITAQFQRSPYMDISRSGAPGRYAVVTVCQEL